ncbi:MAG: hypothetical protein ACI93H_001391, partial [Psychromonas sp.]
MLKENNKAGQPSFSHCLKSGEYSYVEAGWLILLVNALYYHCI